MKQATSGLGLLVALGVAVGLAGWIHRDLARLGERVEALAGQVAPLNGEIQQLRAALPTPTIPPVKPHLPEAKALYYKGVELYVGNRIQEAIEAWEQTLKIEPSYEDASKNIRRAKAKLAALKGL